MWQKRCSNNSVPDVIEELSGVPAAELLNPKRSGPYEIGSLIEASQLVMEAIVSNKKIGIVGDYDADGITSTAILYLLFSHFGIAATVRLPYRFSEGYGLSSNIVEEIAPALRGGLLITVDNGIAANEAIALAKESNITVIVMDHHLQTGELPNADCLVDQHIDELALNGCNKIGFRDYCGAGLAYKLAEAIVPTNTAENQVFLDKLKSIAAIGTIGDIVPLVGDNRAIVKEGLDAIKKGNATIGLKALLNECGFKNGCSSIDIAYKLVPAINASGRLIDNGAKRPCALLASDAGDIVGVAKMLTRINETRKKLVKESIKRVESKISTQQTGAIIVFDEEANEGIVGIIAGKLAEKYGLPAIVLTKGENGIWKGSARSIEGVNVKERFDTISDIFVSYGGHAGAAGVSIRIGDEELFSTLVGQAFRDVTAKENGNILYDIEITPDCVENVYKEIQKFQPFGEGCPEPVIRITGCELTPFNSGCYGLYMGADKSHVKLNCTDNFTILGFSMADEYKSMKEPAQVDVVGRLSMNVSKWGTTLQIIADSIKPTTIYKK